MTTTRRSNRRTWIAAASLVGAVALVATLATLATAGTRARRASDRDRPLATYSGLSAPESVFYDAAGDRYLVSNVNGKPLAADGNGFISVLSPAGAVVTLKWIAGGQNGVKLDAPKGLTISAGSLYVADLATVRIFDARTGAPKATIVVPHATSLSGVAAGPDGKVYVSDAGPPVGRFDGVGTEAVYVIEGERARKLAEGDKLGRPQGLAWSAGGPIVAPFGSTEVYRLDDKGERRDVTPLPAGGLAGVVQAGDSLLVTSWQTSSVYRGKLGGKFEVAFAHQTSPADLGFDAKRGRLLVPHFEEDTVDVYSVP